MKNSIRACALLLATLCSGLAGADEGAKALDAQWEKAVKAGDLDAITALYADDATGWFPGQPAAVGKTAIHDTYAGLMKGNTVKDAKISDGHYLHAGKYSMGWGMFTLILRANADGKETVMKGRYSEIAEQRHGKWLLVVDHASADLPAPN